MLYRENGQFKTSYRADQQIFPILQDRVAILVLAAITLVGVPLFASDYLFRAILIPFAILALAALGLNILVGYCGQISLGTGAFMAVGAYAAYNFVVRVPGMPLLAALLLGGLCATAIGVAFGIPSLRIRGLYLAVATLAAQFFLVWLFNKVAWFTNYASSGTITAPDRTLFGVVITGPNSSSAARYLVALGLVSVFAVVAKNLVRGRIGRSWMAIRDRDIAAGLIGIPLLRYKVLAFVVSAFYAGVAGALVVFCWYGSANIEEFDLVNSVRILGMVIIGGMGSVVGPFLGAGFVTLLPIAISVGLHAVAGWTGGHAGTDLVSSLEDVVFGSLIVLFLAVEPLGLALLWKTVKDYLGSWPFSH